MKSVDDYINYYELQIYYLDNILFNLFKCKENKYLYFIYFYSGLINSK